MSFDLFCIGNALVDREFQTDEAFLDANELAKGTMHLIDLERAERLLEALQDHTQLNVSCGGSAANSAYAASGFGARVFFAGKVADDENGKTFNDQFNRVGIATNPRIESDQLATGHCLVLITSDAERTMNSCLSISDSLSVEDLDESVISQSEHCYIEGYLASSPTGHVAATRVRELAEENAHLVSLTLSDVSMVNGFRDNLELMLGNGVNRLFCNVEEALSWCQTDRADIAINELRDIARTPIVTLGAQGCLIGTQKPAREIPGFNATARDVNGAGDMFAGAYLAAIIGGADEFEAGRFGNYAASRLVEQYGARLETFDAYAQLKARYQSKVKGMR